MKASLNDDAHAEPGHDRRAHGLLPGPSPAADQQRLRQPAILSINLFDVDATVGIQQDVRTIEGYDFEALAVVTAVSWMKHGIRRISKLPVRVLESQIDGAVQHRKIAAAILGYVPSAETARAVLSRLQRRKVPQIVLNPRIRAEDGTLFLASRGAAALRSHLPNVAAVVCSLADGCALCNRPALLETDPSDIASEIVQRGALSAVVDAGPEVIVVASFEGVYQLKRVGKFASSGIASVLACGLARGDTLEIALQAILLGKNEKL